MVTEVSGKKYYDVRLIFRKMDDDSKTVRVSVRHLKIGKFSVDKVFPFTDDIYDNDHNYWNSHQGQQISVYHRKEKNIYVNAKNQSTIPTNLGQKLEAIVLKAIES